MIALGIIGPWIGWKFHPEAVNQSWGPTKAAETFGLVVLLRAFANGCAAMTGTEAVSNGFPHSESQVAQCGLYAGGYGRHPGTIFLGTPGWRCIFMLSTGKQAAAIRLPPYLTSYRALCSVKRDDGPGPMS